jgi:hypothetical protein
MRLETDYINQMITKAISYLIKRYLVGSLPNQSHKPNDNNDNQEKKHTLKEESSFPGYNEPQV